MMAGIDAPSQSRRNPWVGPRALRGGELLPARERETSELTDLLIAERVVLLHAPSGAGKTSLIQAGVVPRLKREWLPQNRSFRPTIMLRVKTPAPKGRVVHNRYVHSIALDLLPDRNPTDLEHLTLPEAVGEAFDSSTGALPVLL